MPVRAWCRAPRRRPVRSLVHGPFVSGEKSRTPSLEHALQHGRGVGGPRLPALDGAAEILDPAATLPDLLELPGKDFRPPLPRQARLLQAQLAHLHVVLSWNERRIQVRPPTRRAEKPAVWQLDVWPTTTSTRSSSVPRRGDIYGLLTINC